MFITVILHKYMCVRVCVCVSVSVSHMYPHRTHAYVVLEDSQEYAYQHASINISAVVK